jgi:hypothetical protein
VDRAAGCKAASPRGSRVAAFGDIPHALWELTERRALGRIVARVTA